MIPSETRHFLRNKLNIAQGALKDTAAGYSLSKVELTDAVHAVEQIVELLSIEESVDTLLASNPTLSLGEFFERAIVRLKQYREVSLQISHFEQAVMQRNCAPEVLRACLWGMLYLSDVAVSEIGTRTIKITYSKDFIRMLREGTESFYGHDTETIDVCTQITESCAAGIALRQCIGLCPPSCVAGRVRDAQLVELLFRL